ncbi:hypothetical protein FH972_012939 [Carpinus fangiana]|uniref:C2 domain-containing protein n=1 Tax=Carpinus fangiana TaxID=176857 RepID=A0A5N6R5I2_9ROSI|nr:hypothetical protein FH972_012939 [Carpinus fangiana]
MAKLVVEVHDASDLMPKDGQGSASPFVEVDLDEQKQRTQTKQKDLNPYWNEKLVFNLNDRGDLHHKTIEVVLYNDRKGGGHHKNFLGRVRISGDSVLWSESEATIQRYPLDKRGLFSHIKGDIALRIYISNDASSASAIPPPPQASGVEEMDNTPLQEINANNLEEQMEETSRVEEKNSKKKKKKEKEVRTFHSLGTAPHPPHSHSHSHPQPHPPQPSMFPGFGFEKEKAAAMETRTDFARAQTGPAANVMQMQAFPTRPNPEFGLEETRPPLAARQSYKTSSTYDLVEAMHFLYVNVVKARELPVMDVTGSLDPYVEVKLGNYKGITNHLEKNQHPVWKQVFAFSRERIQSNLLEVTVKDKDTLTKDDFVGRVVFDLSEVPLRVPPDSPLAPQWYKLVDKKGDKTRGEVMLAVWMGTQADESFPEAWHSDAHNVSHKNLSNTRSQVYFSPKLFYLRVGVIEAQDLLPSDKNRAAETFVKVQLGGQMKFTKTSRMRFNPVWEEELMFVASEPLEDFIAITVIEKVPGKDENLGMVFIPLREIPQRMHESTKPPDPRWLNLHKPSAAAEEETEKKKEKFTSKIHLRLCFEAGYHVLDESTHFSSDLQPSGKHLRHAKIGILEVGILSAKNLLPMKAKDGRTTDAYCVAKYGNKWIRTRTLLDTLAPRWNEQYTWDVYDSCTVITIAVFDNHHTNGKDDDAKDQRIGKVRIRLSTLEAEKVYTHFYPLLVLTPSGLKKHGELHLALRFTCTAWVNMVAQYGRPLLPKMHYVHPIPVMQIDRLRHTAIQIVAERLKRAEPPLRRETVEYMLDVDYHMWSLRKSKANFLRIMSLLSGFTTVCKWLTDICYWRNPITTCLVHVLFLILVCYPELILPTIFLYLFVIGVWNYRFRPRQPPHMDARISQAEFANPDELDEEFDSFPSSKPADLVRMRYDRLRIVGGKVQTVIGDLATHGERAQAILSWRDPRATAIIIIFSLIWAMFIYITPFQVIAVLLGLFLLRHPRFRHKLPSAPVNFFKRLPSRSDTLL